MKPLFHAALVNDPLGDPGLVIQFFFERRNLLFDLGNLAPLTNKTLLKVTHVFVSHTHIDHFIGFDQLLRVVFGRGKILHLYGPANFIANVEGKLAGFTWNLVEKYSESITLDVTEIHADRSIRARFRAIDRFKRTDLGEEPFTGQPLLEEPSFTVHTAILEHRVPCLGFAIKEKFHVNVKKDVLDRKGLAPGPWLNKMKQALYDGKPDEFPVAVPDGGNGASGFRQVPLGSLKEELVVISPGQKVAYVTDTVYNESNSARIVDLVREADLFFCESPFVAEEEERARDRRHLTSRQAGLLAQAAGVKQLALFHFSPRHTFEPERMYREAGEAYQGTVVPPAVFHPH